MGFLKIIIMKNMLNVENIYIMSKKEKNKLVYTLCLILYKPLLHIEDNMQKWE